MSFHQVSPLTQQFSSQQRVPDFNQTQPGQHFAGNQKFGQFYPEQQPNQNCNQGHHHNQNCGQGHQHHDHKCGQGHQQHHHVHKCGQGHHHHHDHKCGQGHHHHHDHKCGQGHQQNHHSGNGLCCNDGNNCNHNEIQYFKTIDQQLNNARQSLQQEQMQGNNPQISHQINEFALDHANQTREIIQQAINMTQQRQYQASSDYERQVYQQRERQLMQLAQITDQVCQIIQKGMNNSDNNQNYQSAQRAIQLINQAQDLNGDMINQTESQMYHQQNNFNQYQMTWGPMSQSPFGRQNYGPMNQQYYNSKFQQGNMNTNWG